MLETSFTHHQRGNGGLFPEQGGRPRMPASTSFHFISIAIAAPGAGLALFPHLTRERM